MSEVFKDISCVELVLRVILDGSELSVQTARTQEILQGWGRSVRLDIFALDKQGKGYNIEIQRADEGASLRRARFHSSRLDVHSLMPGQNFDELRDNYVIFITQNDVLGSGLPLYTIERSVKETGEFVNDGSHILYVNGTLQDAATPLGKLMHDFFCINPDEMYYPILAERTRYFKESEEGIKAMGSVIEELKSEGRLEGAKQTAFSLLKIGKLTLTEIAESVGLPLAEIQELQHRPA